jgi:hypothetical protein
VMTIVMGIAPMWFLRPMEPAVAKLVEHVRRNQGQTVGNPIGVRESGLGIRSVSVPQIESRIPKRVLRLVRSPVAQGAPSLAGGESRR